MELCGKGCGEIDVWERDAGKYMCGKGMRGKEG